MSVATSDHPGGPPPPCGAGPAAERPAGAVPVGGRSPGAAVPAGAAAPGGASAAGGGGLDGASPAGERAVGGAVLAIHPGALGDVLLALPALRALRAAGWRVGLAAQPRLGRLLHALGEVDEAMAVETLALHRFFVEEPTEPAEPILGAARVVSWFGAGDPIFARRLRTVAPDAVVAAPHAAGPSAAGEARLVWEHLRASVGGIAACTLQRPFAGPDLVAPARVPAPLVAAGRQALQAAGWDGSRRLLIVHPGAGGAAKRWPVEGFARALEAVTRPGGFDVAIHEGPADAEAAGGLAGLLGQGAMVLRQPELPVLAGALACAAGYLGNDSGVSHLAAAVGTPALVLFIERHLAWRPWSRAGQALVITAAEPCVAEVARVEASLHALLEQGRSCRG